MTHRFAAGAGVLCALATLGACASGSGVPASSTSGGSVSTSPARSGCGSVPASSGPAAAVATLRVSAPFTATPGAELAVRTTLQVRSDGPRIIVGPALSDLLVVRDGVVVGRSGGVRPQVLVPLALRGGTTRQVQVVPASVRMSGCGEGAAPLAAGRYELVAVLGYRQDALNSGADGARSPGGTQFQLVSDPVVVTVG